MDTKYPDVVIPLTERDLHARITDTLAYYHCRSINPKADHPIMGYHAMSEDQREFLRGRQDEAAAEVVRIIQALLAEQAATIAAVADFADRIERQAPKPQVGGFFAEEIRTLLGSQRTEGQG